MRVLLAGCALAAQCSTSAAVTSAALSAHRSEVASADGAAVSADATLQTLNRLVSHIEASRAAGHSRFVDEAKPDTKIAVKSLDQIIKGLEKEQDAATKLATAREGQCKKDLWKYSPANKAIREGAKMILEAKDSLKALDADVAGLKTQIGGLNKGMTTARDKITQLTKKLKELRAKHVKVATRTKKSLQQLDAVITRAEFVEEEQRNHRDEPSKLNNEVFNLQRLGRQLVSHGESDAPAAPNFLQMARRHQAQQADDEDDDSGDMAEVLETDRRALLQASTVAAKDFRKEEKKLIDLIESQRGSLQKLEAILEDQEPILADKLRQSAETNRSLAMATRVLKRDRLALALTAKICGMQVNTTKSINRQRYEAINLVKMPVKLLQNLDTTALLSEDTSVANGESFVQMHTGMRMRLGAAISGANLDEAVKDALHAAASSEEGEEGVDAVDTQSHEASAVALPQSSSSAAAYEGAAGPFDDVEKMLRSLIANLNDQANSDTNLHQWCLDSKAENDKSRLTTKAAEESAGTQILWAEAAIAKVDDQISFFSAEIKRLDTQAAEVTKDFKSESTLLSKQLTDHRAARDVLLKVVTILKAACNINDSDMALLQSQEDHITLNDAAPKKNKKQCAAAAKLLLQSKIKLLALDNSITSYRSSYTIMANAEAQAAKAASAQRKKDLASATLAKTKRGQDLETAKADQRQKKKDLLLVEKAAQTIDKKCSVRETHSERMARKQDEIDALKSAYKVLNGEEIPVVSSLVSISEQGHK